MSASPILVTNNFPSVPLGPVVDKDGILTGPWQQFFIQISMFMNQGFNSEGIKLPQQPNSVLTGSGALNTIKSEGNVIYNSDAKTGMINLNGVYKTIQTA